jgi:hypothetical protein
MHRCMSGKEIIIVIIYKEYVYLFAFNLKYFRNKPIHLPLKLIMTNSLFMHG